MTAPTETRDYLAELWRRFDNYPLRAGATVDLSVIDDWMRDDLDGWVKAGCDFRPGSPAYDRVSELLALRAYLFGLSGN